MLHFSGDFVDSKFVSQSDSRIAEIRANIWSILRMILRNSIANFHLAFIFSFSYRGKLLWRTYTLVKCNCSICSWKNKKELAEDGSARHEDENGRHRDRGQNFSPYLSYLHWQNRSYKREMTWKMKSIKQKEKKTAKKNRKETSRHVWFVGNISSVKIDEIQNWNFG